MSVPHLQGGSCLRSRPPYNDPPMLLPAAVVVSAYLLGSIPFSYLVVRIVAGADIRKHGSRNVGATNVARTFGKLPGIIALMLDIAKGYAAVLAAQWMVTIREWPYRAGFGVT